MTPELRKDLSNNLALRDRLRTTVFTPEAAAGEADWERTSTTARLDPALPPEDTIASLQDAAQDLATSQILDYFVDKLESHTVYLRTGERPTNWPELAAETSLSSNGSMRAVCINAEVIGLSLDCLQEDLGARGPEVKERFHNWAADTSNLLLSRNCVGWAASIINNIPQEKSQPVLDQLTAAMQRIRETEGDEDYRDAYAYITRTLNEPLRDAFVQQCEQIGTPLMLGSQHELTIEDGHQTMVERFVDDDNIQARLVDGSTIELPYQSYMVRSLSDYGSPREREMYTTQRTVDYDDLDPDAQAAVRIAWEAEVTQRLREETLPYYARLALSPEGGTSTLHTVNFRDGHRRALDTYPDDSGFMTGETELQIGSPVTTATPVLDTYMVVPYNDGYRHTYRDAEPNFFGPGEEHANAFWVTGQPREIVDRNGDPRLMQTRATDGSLRARWVLVPVRYYQVEQQPTNDYEDTGQWRL